MHPRLSRRPGEFSLRDIMSPPDVSGVSDGSAVSDISGVSEVIDRWARETQLCSMHCGRAPLRASSPPARLPVESADTGLALHGRVTHPPGFNTRRRRTPMMRMTFRHVAALFALSLAAFPFAACGSDPEFYDLEDCEIGSPLEGSTCECSGADCVCPSSGDCAINCVEGCNLQCAGSGSCDFFCAAGCNTECTGSGNCDIDVGDDSNVACTGSGDCDVTCAGKCKVTCPGSATCTVGCAPNTTCTITIDKCSGEVQDCAGGVKVCNGSCPG